MSLSPTYAPANDRSRHGETGRDEDPDRLVFVDSTGRRAVYLRRAALVVGAAFVAYAIMLGVAFMGGTSLAPTEASTPAGGTPAGSTPAGTATNSGSHSVHPGGVPPAWRRLCRQECRNCGKQLAKLCRREAVRRALGGSNGPLSARPSPSSGTGSRGK